MNDTADQPPALESGIAKDKPATADPDLEAALGDMFATPPKSVDRWVPFSAADKRGTTGSAGVLSTHPHAHESIDGHKPQSGQPAGPEGGVTVSSQQQASTPGQTESVTQPSIAPDNGQGAIRPARPGDLINEPDFAAPDEIAPDPTPDRSHIDTRIEPPFATDFTETLSPGMLGERRGQHVHADLNRRRAVLNLGWFCLAAIAGSVIGTVWLARESVVRMLPGTADFYAAIGQPVNTRGLDFRDISYGWTTDNGRPAIDVTGKIRNLSGVTLEIPTIVFVLLDDRGDELYNWASRVRDEPLAAGSETQFRARVPAPPGAARRLRVRFARKSR